MCDLTLAGLAVGALSSGASAIGQRQQAKAQYQAQLQQVQQERIFQEQTAQAQRMISGRQITGDKLRELQQREALNRELREDALRTEKELSEQRVAFAERGITGQTQVALVNDYMALEGARREAYQRQKERIRLGTELAIEDKQLGLQQKLTSIYQPIAEPVRPRGFGLQDVLGIAAGGLQGAVLARSLNIGSSSTTVPSGDGGRMIGLGSMKGRELPLPS